MLDKTATELKLVNPADFAFPEIERGPWANLPGETGVPHILRLTVDALFPDDLRKHVRAVSFRNWSTRQRYAVLTLAERLACAVVDGSNQAELLAWALGEIRSFRLVAPFNSVALDPAVDMGLALELALLLSADGVAVYLTKVNGTFDPGNGPVPKIVSLRKVRL